MNIFHLCTYILFIIMIALFGVYHHYYTKCNTTIDNNKNAFEINNNIDVIMQGV